MKIRNHLLIVLMISILIAACGGSEGTAPAEMPVTPTVFQADPCSAENLPGEVGKVNSLMREFDDYARLASNTPQDQLVIVIPEMQRVLRQAQDQVVPSCLTTLKEYQISHMDIVVQILIAFMGSSDTEVVNAGILKARELHNQYDIELARLLGITLLAPTSAPTSAAPTAIPAVPTAAPTPMVTNPGPNELNLRTAPDFNAPAADILGVQASTPALGKTADSLWIQIEVPNKPGTTAWVYATNVDLSVAIEQLPVVTP